MNETTRQRKGDWHEERRLQAWTLKQKGWKQKDIAEALGVSQGAVSQWIKAGREGGEKALYGRKASGRPRELTKAQRAELPRLLEKGAESHGFRGGVWTRGRVREVIWRHFGVTYDPSHVGRILKELGWTLQKPVKRASQRQEAVINAWPVAEWPALKKSPGRGADDRVH